MSIGPVELIFILGFFALFGWATGAVARRKGYSFALFFVLGGLFFPIPLIVAAFLPSRHSAPPAPGAPSFRT